jgi:hypothetical protein
MVWLCFCISKRLARGQGVEPRYPAAQLVPDAGNLEFEDSHEEMGF